MYFIMKVTPNNLGEFVTYQLIHHTTGTISIALKDLERIAYDYVREEGGKQAASDAKILDIENPSMIIEPYVDCMIIYRYENNPHKLHIYQRKTSVVPGLIYGKTYQTEFKQVVVFELLTYDKINNAQLIQDANNIEPIELVPVNGKNIKIPAKLTQSPMIDVISQLKKFSVGNLKKVPPKPTVDKSLENSTEDVTDNNMINPSDFFRQAKKIMANGLNNHVSKSDNNDDDSNW